MKSSACFQSPKFQCMKCYIGHPEWLQLLNTVFFIAFLSVKKNGVRIPGRFWKMVCKVTLKLFQVCTRQPEKDRNNIEAFVSSIVVGSISWPFVVIFQYLRSPNHSLPSHQILLRKLLLRYPVGHMKLKYTEPSLGIFCSVNSSFEILKAKLTHLSWRRTFLIEQQILNQTSIHVW